MSYLQGIHALAMTLSVALISPLSDAQAQSYPEKAVRLIVPFTAGGGADNLGRIIGEQMRKNKVTVRIAAVQTYKRML